jgi:hypothetical protein
VDRLTYQECLAAGGARIDLDGNVAGEVSSEQRCRAERMVRQAAAIPAVLDRRVVVMPPLAKTTPSTGSGRLGLAELKRAAQERRARQETNRAD